MSEDGSSTDVDVQLYGPATQLTCVLDGGNSFACKYYHDICVKFCIYTKSVGGQNAQE